MLLEIRNFQITFLEIHTFEKCIKKIDFLKPDYQNIPLNHTSYRSTLTIQQCGVTVEQTIVFASCRSDASRSTIRRSAISQNVPWELEDNQTKNCPHREKNLKLNIHDQ